MTKRVLDLFCGAGGAARGYRDAGFDVMGVDIEPRKRFPFAFAEADAMTYPLDGFDAIHASPPCHDHSTLSGRTGVPHGTGWMLSATIERLRAHGARTGTPWVVENVETADMPGAVTLCGSMFNLGAEGRTLKRHRKFLASFPIEIPRPCTCRGALIGGVYGNGGGGKMTRGYKFKVAAGREAMGIPWMSQVELSQAIPPAYTAWIGGQIPR